MTPLGFGPKKRGHQSELEAGYLGSKAMQNITLIDILLK